jgi:hypothetical protein
MADRIICSFLLSAALTLLILTGPVGCTPIIHDYQYGTFNGLNCERTQIQTRVFAPATITTVCRDTMNADAVVMPPMATPTDQSLTNFLGDISSAVMQLAEPFILAL